MSHHSTAVFPVWAATHQVNRVAALALATAEALAFGPAYMAQIVSNAQALAKGLQDRGIPMLGAAKGFTRTHQVIADVGRYGRGLAAAQKLERANIIVNKNLLPNDKPEDWDYPSGLRIGTIDPFIAQHLAALGHAALVAFFFVHGRLLQARRKLSTVSV